MCSAQAGRGRDCGAKPVPAAPTARFNGGFNTGVRGGYEWGPWRFEEEYSYRQNGARDVVGSNFTVNAAGGTGTAIRS